jgi:hypothetical protein
MNGKGNRAKCLFYNGMVDSLADHLQATQEGHTAYIIQELMIRTDQMKNKITQLQSEGLIIQIE